MCELSLYSTLLLCLCSPIKVVSRLITGILCPLYLSSAYDGILRLMANVSMIAAAPKTTYPPPVVTNDVRIVKALKGGFTEVLVKLNDEVKEGDRVAYQVCVYIYNASMIQLSMCMRSHNLHKTAYFGKE